MTAVKRISFSCFEGNSLLPYAASSKRFFFCETALQILSLLAVPVSPTSLYCAIYYLDIKLNNNKVL